MKSSELENSLTIQELISMICKSIAMFFYVFSFTIYGLLNGEVLSIILGFIPTVFLSKKMIIDRKELGTKTWLCFVRILLLFFVYSLIVLFMSDSGALFDNSFSRILIFVFLYGTAAFLIFSNWFKNLDELFASLYIICMFQCFIILITLISPSFADYIDTFSINSNQYFDYAIMRQMGYHGGIACVTSTGALQLSLGLISCIYFILKKENNIFFIVSYVFFTAIITAVARTGLVLGIVGIIILLFLSGRNKKYKMFSWIMVLLLLLILLSFYTDLGNEISRIFIRTFGIAETGLYDGFFASYFQESGEQSAVGIPPLSVETFFGVGITNGTSGNGVYISADGGYFRTYAAIGLPLSMLLYLILLVGGIKQIIRIHNKDLKIVCSTFIVFMIIGEFKEPYILFTRYMLVLFFVFLSLVNKSYREKIKLEHQQYLTEGIKNEL